MNSKGKKALRKLDLARHRLDSALLKQAKKDDNIVYGGRAIKRRLGINARRTDDWDLFSKTPKQSALSSDKEFDKILRGNVFFTKKGSNPTTWKVKHVGKDLKPKTKDDIGIVDYTKTPKPQPKTFDFRGVNYRTLKEELKAKKKLLSDKQFQFRSKKDLEDLKRIKKFGGLK